MAPEIQKSDIVLSQSGRDQGRMRVVLDTDADYLLLADGRREGAKLSNSDVRRALQEWQQPTIAE